MLRLGLCCIFHEAPIKFRTTTFSHQSKVTRTLQLQQLAAICRHNANSLLTALEYCDQHGIGAFRINSQILPLKTHPVAGYDILDLPEGDEIRQLFRKCGRFARAANIRTLFHPDQFVVLNSPRPTVLESSVAELEYQAEVAAWVGADVINIHGGGSYGDKVTALKTLQVNLKRLSKAARSRLTLENDDKLFTPSDLLPICRAAKISLVYDVHHHRCNPDGLSVEEATTLAIATWNREPVFHISSPLEGWSGPKPQRHHDYINISDVPEFWYDLDITIEVEAKAKEVAIAKLQRDLSRHLSA